MNLKIIKNLKRMLKRKYYYFKINNRPALWDILLLLWCLRWEGIFGELCKEKLISVWSAIYRQWLTFNVIRCNVARQWVTSIAFAQLKIWITSFPSKISILNIYHYRHYFCDIIISFFKSRPLEIFLQNK